MDLYLLAELKTISLKVTTVDMQKPPPDFRTNFQATPPPILIDNGDAILENEKIERHIMKNIPGGHNLFVQDKEVATLVENLFSVSVDRSGWEWNQSRNRAVELHPFLWRGEKSHVGRSIHFAETQVAVVEREGQGQGSQILVVDGASA